MCNFDTATLVPRLQSAVGDHPPVIHSRQKNPDDAAEPRVPRIENFSGFGTMGARLMTCTTSSAYVRLYAISVPSPSSGSRACNHVPIKAVQDPGPVRGFLLARIGAARPVNLCR
jgi:hypothetical protein